MVENIFQLVSLKGRDHLMLLILSKVSKVNLKLIGNWFKFIKKTEPFAFQRQLQQLWEILTSSGLILSIKGI